MDVSSCFELSEILGNNVHRLVALAPIIQRLTDIPKDLNDYLKDVREAERLLWLIRRDHYNDVARPPVHMRLVAFATAWERETFLTSDKDFGGPNDERSSSYHSLAWNLIDELIHRLPIGEITESEFIESFYFVEAFGEFREAGFRRNAEEVYEFLSAYDLVTLYGLLEKESDLFKLRNGSAMAQQALSTSAELMRQSQVNPRSTNGMNASLIDPESLIIAILSRVVKGEEPKPTAKSLAKKVGTTKSTFYRRILPHNDTIRRLWEQCSEPAEVLRGAKRHRGRQVPED